MTRVFLFLLLLTMTIAGCKKKEDSQVSSSNTTTGGSYLSPTTSTATTFYGILATGIHTVIVNGIPPLISKSAYAYFSSVPVQDVSSGNRLKVKSVYIGNDSLPYNSGVNYYTNDYSKPITSEAWTINALNGIPSFRYTNNNNYPACSNLNVLPDSISLHSGFSIKINNVTNISLGYIYVYSPATSAMSLAQSILAGDNTFTFHGVDSSQDLSPIGTGTNNVIMVFMENSKAVNVSGKDFKFSKEFQFSKYIKVNP